MTTKKTAVVLGAYGLIGAACARSLANAGFHVVGVGRSKTTAHRVLPDIEWHILDLAAAHVDDLRTIVTGADVVVNAAGALQDGLKDNVVAIHETMMRHLVAALQDAATRVIQISAAGVSEDASTEFFRSKARGDRVLMTSGLDWVVLRPTLVIAPQAYGGTALLRASAAMPLIEFAVLPASRVQTVSLDDVADAVVSAARDEIACGTVGELTENHNHGFSELVGSVRGWLGFTPWRLRMTVPLWAIKLLARVADALGGLGWRSPFRTTAITVLQDGIRGNPAPWNAAGGAPCRSLDETLASMPADIQERWFARLYLLLPVIIGTLAVFWLLSGLIGLMYHATAVKILTEHGFSDLMANFFVSVGAIADIALGGAIVVRRFARKAALGMMAVSLGYVAAATFFTTSLWADPLGPLVKVLPGIVLVLVAAALLDER